MNKFTWRNEAQRNCDKVERLVMGFVLVHHSTVNSHYLEPIMSAVDLEALKKAAMELSERERAKLASDLVASLDGPVESGVAEAWDIEICRRINEIEAGTAKLLDVDEVLKRARARLGS